MRRSAVSHHKPVYPGSSASPSPSPHLTRGSLLALRGLGTHRSHLPGMGSSHQEESDLGLDDTVALTWTFCRRTSVKNQRRLFVQEQGCLENGKAIEVMEEREYLYDLRTEAALLQYGLSSPTTRLSFSRMGHNLARNRGFHGASKRRHIVFIAVALYLVKRLATPRLATSPPSISCNPQSFPLLLSPPLSFYHRGHAATLLVEWRHMWHSTTQVVPS
ncbi:hypothetical protein BKA70DRAFT_486480 [Coprinopsis sp. MPI-PUGE-AT-0042]|nr:hypothetical protein BKA70DRAFT_486480 [Coprinopsis sp. MPI-PUGE-AT-0042]